jgi:ribosomal protein L29
MGDMAYEMEKKSREEFAEDLPELQRELFEKYRRVCSIYQGVQK